MARPKKVDGESTRAKLLRAAEVQFGARGFHGARLEDIAAAAEIKRSSLLYHFGTKEGLYTQVVAAATADLMATMMGAMVGPERGIDRVVAVVDALNSYARARRGAVSMFVRELLDGAPARGTADPDISVALDALEQFVRHEVGDRLPEGVRLRSVILNLFTSQALRFASGDLGDQLWAEEDDAQSFIRSLLEST